MLDQKISQIVIFSGNAFFVHTYILLLRIIQNIWKKENKRLRVASIHRGHTASLRLAGGHLTGLGHAAKTPCEGLEPPNPKDHRSSGAARFQLHQHGLITVFPRLFRTQDNPQYIRRNERW